MGVDAPELMDAPMDNPVAHAPPVMYIPPCSVQAAEKLCAINALYQVGVDFTLADRMSMLKNVDKELQDKNWMTPGLVTEVQNLFPNKDEIDSSNNNKRDPFAFQVKAAQLFPIGHIFASPHQLEQASTMFLNAWAVT